MPRAAVVALTELERTFEDGSGVLVPRAARERAYARATVVVEALGSTDELPKLAAHAFASALFGALAVELAARLPKLRRLVDRVEVVSGVPRVAVGSMALADPALLQLPTGVAMEVQLALLLAFTRARHVSVWDRPSGGELKQVAQTGQARGTSRHAGQLAQRLLAGEPIENATDAPASGFVIPVSQQPRSALIVHGSEAALQDRTCLVAAALPLFTAILERDDLLARRGAFEQAIVAATERRLARLRFDLHDGPQQDLVLLAEDLHQFASQLSAATEGRALKDRLLDQLADIQSRLVALDGDLRRISQAAESPFLQREPLGESLARLVDEFTERTSLKPSLTLRGDFSRLSDSQLITLLGLIREALSNIREHSDAKHVTILLSASAASIKATVKDDGRGFDPETTLVQAAREGHLGLVGMHERVRLLGGRAQIDSRPGGPTVISVSLPAGAPAAPPRG